LALTRTVRFGQNGLKISPVDHASARCRGGPRIGRRRGRLTPQRAPIGATTDAWFYLNQFGVPTLAYGPRARNIHAIDEAVELTSIVTGAKTMARFVAACYAGEVIPS
jgi:hypothetical protein